MTLFIEEQIEEAFARIRAEFEKRNNEVGLEILDGYEEQWAATGSLSDRQQSWLDRQLDGTWRPVGTNQRTDYVETTNPAPSEEADLLDVIIERRMAAHGKTLINADQVARLKRLVGDLNDVLRDV